MLERSLWKCLLFWLVGLHLFPGSLAMGSAGGVSTGQCFRARGRKRKTQTSLIRICTGVSESHRHSFFSPTTSGFGTGTSEFGLKNSTAAEILIIPERPAY